VANGATVLLGGTLSGPGSIAGATSDAGKVLGALVSGTVTVSAGGVISGGSIASGGSASVLSGGVAQAVTVSSGGSATVASGGVASALVVTSGATIVDDGAVVYTGSTAVTYAALLSGSGMLVEEGSGSLVLSGGTAAFAGALVLSGGTAELANTAGVGAGDIIWASPTTATLKIDAADGPLAGTTFSSTLSNFDEEYDILDLKGLAFVSGATAVLSGSTLALTDGGAVYDFQLAGTAAAAYAAITDGSGGTMIKASTTTQVPASHVHASFVQAMAAFGADASAPLGGYVTSTTLGNIGLIAAHVGSAAMGSAWHAG
jgi:hypothetical protein